MTDWLPVTEDAPHGVEVMLWLKPDIGDEKPIGRVIATYKKTDMGEMWCAKALNGDINTGLRADLITHYCLLEGEPDGQRSDTQEVNSSRNTQGLGR